MTSQEKDLATITHIDEVEVGKGNFDAVSTTFVEPNAKALSSGLRKLDCYFLPAVTMIYFLSFLDRSNIGNAKAAGLQADLGLSDYQYSMALTLTYIPYILAEMPLTLLLRVVGPNILMPTLMVIWGVVTMCQGFVTNYVGLVLCRVFLGAAEGAIIPACITYLATFYRRQDLGKRTAFFFCATSLAGAFSGLLAAAILKMEGVAGKRGWMWIFIIEGLITAVYGMISFFILPNNPTVVGYWTEEEREAVLLALDNDRPVEETHEAFSAKAVLGALAAPQMWLIATTLFCSGVSLFAMAYFSPSIVGSSLGYTGIKVQLYSVPPYAVSTVISLACSWYSDKLNMRGPFIVGSTFLSLIGYAIYYCSAATDKSARYVSLFFMISGAYIAAPLLSVWMSNNHQGYYRRISAVVMGFVFSNAGGILSTWLFPKAQAPNYKKGTSILLAMSSTLIAVAAIAMAYLHIRNKQKAAKGGFTEERGTLDDTVALGDRSVHFKYTL